MTTTMLRDTASMQSMFHPESISSREVDHRVANSLQIISSLLSLQAKRTRDASARDALMTAVHRIGAIGAIHRQLYCHNSANLINIAHHLFTLAELLERSFSDSVGGRQIGVHVQSQMISPEFAGIIGILITEIVINACKHAYTPDEAGAIDICLFFPTKAEFRLEVRDYGMNNDRYRMTSNAGLGSSLIKSICRTLKADYNHLADPEGTRFLANGTVL